MSRRYLKAEQWRELIAKQAAGTESIVAFCQRHGLIDGSSLVSCIRIDFRLALAPLTRTFGGAFKPILEWRHMGDQ